MIANLHPPIWDHTDTKKRFIQLIHNIIIITLYYIYNYINLYYIYYRFLYNTDYIDYGTFPQVSSSNPLQKGPAARPRHSDGRLDRSHALQSSALHDVGPPLGPPEEDQKPATLQCTDNEPTKERTPQPPSKAQGKWMQMDTFIADATSAYECTRVHVSR